MNRIITSSWLWLAYAMLALGLSIWLNHPNVAQTSTICVGISTILRKLEQPRG